MSSRAGETRFSGNRRQGGRATTAPRRLGCAIVVLLLGAAGQFGCSAQPALGRAQQRFAVARAAGAESAAPYDFYAAESYLQLAEHELEEQDRRQARIYAEKSVSFSERALARAERSR